MLYSGCANHQRLIVAGFVVAFLKPCLHAGSFDRGQSGKTINPRAA